MAGAPSFGKMSTFIPRIAMIDASAIEMTATRTVMGRRMAVNTNHMASVAPNSCESAQREPNATRHPPLSDPVEERREIPARLCRRQQRPPYSQPRHRIVGLGLREQPLRFRNVG